MKTMSRLCVLMLIILIVIPGSVVQAAKPAGGNDRGGIAVPGTGVRSNDTLPSGTDVAPEVAPVSKPPAEEPLLSVATGPSYTEVWDGRGTDSERCDYMGQEGRPETGWIHWVFSTKGDSTDARLILGGTGSGTYMPGEPLNAEVWHFYTPFFELEGLTATIELVGGMPGPGGGLVISDYCPGRPVKLDVTKTAETSFTRTRTWTIDKWVDVDEWHLFRGDSATSKYTIELKKKTVDSAYMVTGTITITNPSAYPAELASVEDVAGGVMAMVDCPSMTVPAYGTLVCTYVAGPLEKETFGDWNVVTVTPKDMTKFEGGTAKAEIDFGKAKIVYKGLDKVTLEDSYAGVLGEFSADATVTYKRTFTCDGDEGKHENTAWLQGTDISDSAWVKVYCYVLEVKKDAKAHLTRTWEWMIDKVGDKSMLELEMGEKMMLHYMVTVSAMSKDSGWGVHGTIWVKNPAPIDAVITGVEDMISPDISEMVDCGVTFPYTLPAGHTLTCSYEADLADGMARTNTAKVTLKNSPTGLTTFTGWAEIDWSKAKVTEYDECIDVKDDKYGFLGTVCAPQSPHTFHYELMIGPYDKCGEFTFTNKAWFITNDTGTKGWDSWTVTITVPCMGCTLTQGYWKTHSEFGPAPYDETWSMLPMGASTPFYMSGQTWYEVFNTPTKGNAYYILAVQYMAARLNVLNGAGTPATVETALAEANALFEAYTPAQIAMLKGGDPLRAEFIRLAWILDKYNMGQMGIPHCDGDYMSKS